MLIRLVRKVAQAGRADFGMCLISPPTTFGWVKVGSVDALLDSGEATTVPASCRVDVDDAVAGADADVDVDADETGGRDWFADGGCDDSGSLSEPGHGLFLGPCR